MISQIRARVELLSLVGQPVRVHATIGRVGIHRNRQERQSLRTLLLEQIHLDGVAAPVSHAWIQLGETASERARRFGTDLIGCHMQMNAEVGAYKSGDGDEEYKLGFRYCSEMVVEVHGKVRTLIRRAEHTVPERGDVISDARSWEINDELLREAQLPVMQALQLLDRLDRANLQSLQRFFVREQSVTPGQLKHALQTLERRGGPP